MPGVGLLYRVHRQRANRIYAQLVKAGVVVRALVSHQCLAHSSISFSVEATQRQPKDNSFLPVRRKVKIWRDL
jgi:hypothetical protein